MTRTFEDILAGAKLPEDTVTLCLNLDLVREYEELERQLRNAPSRPESLADVSPAVAIAEQMHALREQMLGAEVTFHLRALPARQWAALYGARPDLTDGSDEAQTQWYAWFEGMVSRVCYEPAMTSDQVGRLVAVISAAQWARLSDACWGLNSETQQIPLSVAASAITSTTVES